MQSTGVMAQVKHYAVYNQETNRNTSDDNAVICTQAEQEIYLPAFQAAIAAGRGLLGDVLLQHGSTAPPPARTRTC